MGIFTNLRLFLMLMLGFGGVGYLLGTITVQGIKCGGVALETRKYEWPAALPPPPIPPAIKIH